MLDDERHFRKPCLALPIWAALWFVLLAAIVDTLVVINKEQYWSIPMLWGMVGGGFFVLREPIIQAFRRRVTWSKPYLIAMYEAPYPRKRYVWRGPKRIRQIERLMERRVMKSEYVLFAEVTRLRATIWFRSEAAMIAFRLAYSDDPYIDFDIPEDLLI